MRSVELYFCWLLAIVLVCHAIGSGSASPWPRNQAKSPKRLQNSNHWRMQNVLAMASNKSVCSGDFYLLIDSSPSIGAAVFESLKSYAHQLISMFAPMQVQYDNLNIGLVQFSSRAEVLSQLIPPRNLSLQDALEDAHFNSRNTDPSSIVRAFRLLTTASLWETPKSHEDKHQNPSEYDITARRRKWKARAARADDISRTIPDRRRLIVVFTNGEFADSDIGMTMASLHVSRQMASHVLFVGVNGGKSRINVHKLMTLAESPNHIYLLGSLARDGAAAVDALSAWNLAAYLCYTMQDVSERSFDRF